MTTVTTTPTGTTCPKCGFRSDMPVHECLRCGVIIDKALHAETHPRPEPSPEPAAPGSAAERLAIVDALVIKQQVEKWEAFTGWETANQYTVKDPLGNVLFVAAEEAGSAKQLVFRQLLKALRPFTIQIQTPQGEPFLALERPFRFIFQELTIRGARGEELGSVRMRFTLFNRIYTVTDSSSGREYELFGPAFRPWTFKIRSHGQECGVIRKKWSGGFKELLTDADNFGIEFPREIDARTKAVLLGAVFLIDFVHFEDNNRN